MVGFRAGAKVPNIYEIAIKHSLEEELADIALIMMDFAATNDIEIDPASYLFDMDIKDSLMAIVKHISSINHFSSIDKIDEYYVEYWSRVYDKVDACSVNGISTSYPITSPYLSSNGNVNCSVMIL